jgi:hypothetical protein
MRIAPAVARARNSPAGKMPPMRIEQIGRSDAPTGGADFRASDWPLKTCGRGRDSPHVPTASFKRRDDIAGPIGCGPDLRHQAIDAEKKRKTTQVDRPPGGCQRHERHWPRSLM